MSTKEEINQIIDDLRSSNKNFTGSDTQIEIREVNTKDLRDLIRFAFWSPEQALNLKGIEALTTHEDNLVYIANNAPPAIGAVVFDLLWHAKKNSSYLESSISRYVEAINTIYTNSAKCLFAVKQLNRAIKLAAQTQNKNAITAIDQLLDKLYSHTWSWEFRDLPILLASKSITHDKGFKNRGPSEQFAQRMLALAKESISSKEWGWMELFFEKALECAQAAKNQDLRRKIIIEYIAGYYAWGEFAYTKHGALAASHRYEQAIILGAKNGIKDLRAYDRYNYLCEEGKQEFKAIEIPLDESTRTTFDNAVRSTYKEYYEFTLDKALENIPSLLHELCIKTSNDQDNIWNSIFPTVIVKQDCRKVDTITKNLEELHQYATVIWPIVFQCRIKPAVEALLKKQRNLEYIKHAVHNSPLAFGVHCQLIEEGIIAGLDGKWHIAAHLLLPQLEYLLRNMLKLSGINTIDYINNQREKLLNWILDKDNAGTLNQILGEDIVYLLHGLLIQEAGLNFRNDCAHGLLHTEHIMAPILVWLLVWYIITNQAIKEVPHEEAKKAAYALWEENGKQHGKDKEHYYQAEKLVNLRIRA